MSDVEPGVINSGNGSHGNNSPKPAEAPTTRQFRKTAFLREEGTGRVTDRLTGRETGTEPEWVDLNETVERQYLTFLKRHTDGLLRVHKLKPDILDSKFHAHDKKLFEQFTTEKIVEDETGTRKVIKTINEDAMRKYLDTDEGWAITTMLLEHETALMLASVGLSAVFKS